MKRWLTIAVVAGCGEGGPAPDTEVEPLTGPACEAADPDRQLESECCTTRAPLPARVATVIDLRGQIAAGSCAQFRDETHPELQAFRLPGDPAAYPIKIVLPQLSGADPACAPICNEFPADEPTAFGIAIGLDPGLIGGNSQRGLSIYVPAPWKFVSGGCGEACPWVCLGGYQEFGVRSCTTLSHGEFGFATADDRAPSVEAIVELIDLGSPIGEGACCHVADG